MDARRKYQLFRQSQHFCSVPWNQFKLDPNGDVRTCGQGLDIMGNIRDNTIDEILHTDRYRSLRRDLAQDRPTANCARCHQQQHLEAPQQYRYLRDHYNQVFKMVDVDYDDDGAFALTGIDLHWSSTCNLRCVTCWEKQSSAIAQELKLPIETTTETEVEFLIDWLVDRQSELREIYLSGGEPLLIKHNLRLLRRLRRDQQFVLRVNSNFTQHANNQIMRELLEFPRVLMTISADDIGTRFEYIRHGAQWQTFLGNVKRYHGTHLQWRVNSVFFVASAVNLIDTQQYFRDQFGFEDFTINQCAMEKHALRCRNLAQPLKDTVRQSILQAQQQWHHDANLVGQYSSCLQELDLEPTPHSYQQYFDDIDRRRGTNWRATFPELAHG